MVVEAVTLASPIVLIGHPDYRPRGSTDAVVKAFSSRSSKYTAYDIDQIVDGYIDRCADLSIDWAIALGQVAHETGWLSSEWCARPHRNPAGIGVTGEPGKGVSFDSWKVSTKAHLGRLLAYAFNDDDERMTDEQRFTIGGALAFRPLSTWLRGNMILDGLNYRWAVGGGYAKAVAAKANMLIEISNSS